MARTGVDGVRPGWYIRRARGVHIIGTKRTNIELDEELVGKALAATGLKTKKAVVEEGLKLLVRLKGQEKLRDLAGKVQWEGDLDQMRRNRFPDWS